MSNLSTRQLTAAAVIAALYAALTLWLPIPQYGAIQLRVAEAMTVLPFLFPEAILGLTAGCFIANFLGSPIFLDWIFGTLATFLAAVCTSRVKSKWLAPLPPVVCNALIVGSEIAWFSTQDGQNFWAAWAYNGFTVGIGEALACYVLGLLLLKFLPKRSIGAARRGPNQT